MLIYLDMCSIHRPLDDKSQVRIWLESEAVLGILALCDSGEIEMISSVVLEYETARNPNPIRKSYALDVLSGTHRFIRLSPDIEQQALVLNQAGLKPLDALHLACAVGAGADYFCTCDDRLLRRARAAHTGPPKIVSPLELIAEIG